MPELTLAQAMDTALAHHRAGRLVEAERGYRQILALEPQHADALHHMGILAQQAGHVAVAEDLIRCAIKLKPGSALMRSNLGWLLGITERRQEAVAVLEEAIALKPDLVEAHFHLGNVLEELGRSGDARKSLERALELRPGHADAWCNLGSVLGSLGQPEQGLAALDQALGLQPGHQKAHINRGNALLALGRAEEAQAAFEKALGLGPESAELCSNLGNCLVARGRLEEAVAMLRRAVALKPGWAGAHSNLGNALKNVGGMEEALAAFRRALELDPAESAAHDNLLYTLHYAPGVEVAELAEEHRRWSVRFEKPLEVFQRAHFNEPDPERRLRVGYVSGDFRDHPVGRHLGQFLGQHDRSQVEVFGYHQAPCSDAVTAQLRVACDHWRKMAGCGGEEFAERVRADGIDILVDCALHSAGNRLLVFARKPAPVQVSGFGYPGSAGLGSIQYRLSDRFLAGGCESDLWSDRAVLLPDSFWLYGPEEGVEVNGLPARESGRVTFGSLNNFCKVNRALVELWAQVLLAVPGSRLRMLAPEGSHRERVLAWLERCGVERARVEFAAPRGRREFLELHHGVDLMLDTFPYNGHTTSLDALWMGVPVVSLCGELAVSRGGLSIMSVLGMEDLAAQNGPGYVAKAVELAGNLPLLAALRGSLRGRLQASALMDGARYAGSVESAYRGMWRRWCLGGTGGAGGTRA